MILLLFADYNHEPDQRACLFVRYKQSFTHIKVVDIFALVSVMRIASKMPEVYIRSLQGCPLFLLIEHLVITD